MNLYNHIFNINNIDKNIDNLGDILDTKLYKHLSSPGQVLHNDLNFSYVLNTDGCQAANSSTTTIWPGFMKIVGLPLEIRNKHFILAGVWVNSAITSHEYFFTTTGTRIKQFINFRSRMETK